MLYKIQNITNTSTYSDTCMRARYECISQTHRRWLALPNNFLFFIAVGGLSF